MWTRAEEASPWSCIDLCCWSRSVVKLDWLHSRCKSRRPVESLISEMRLDSTVQIKIHGPKTKLCKISKDYTLHTGNYRLLHILCDFFHTESVPTVKIANTGMQCTIRRAALKHLQCWRGDVIWISVHACYAYQLHHALWLQQIMILGTRKLTDCHYEPSRKAYCCQEVPFGHM